MIDPAKITNANVFKIHASCRSERKREYTSYREVTSEKSFSINTPKTTPLKSEKMTFLVYNAKKIAKTEGKRERYESSMENS